jgi:hypothetical protein
MLCLRFIFCMPWYSLDTQYSRVRCVVSFCNGCVCYFLYLYVCVVSMDGGWLLRVPVY